MSEKKWYADTGEHGDVVLSSRARLARNIDGLPFPVRLNPSQRMAVTAKVASLLKNDREKLKLIDMSKLYPYEAVSLAERHLVSPEFVSSTDGKALILSENEKISIMLNEEDHIRIQAIEGGLQVEKAYENACRYDDILDAGLHFAFDNRLGFLTQNPANLGTGLRISVMLHLPALSKTGDMLNFSSMLSNLGFNIRGSYGDTVSAAGDIYRLSNQVTLGISENDAIANLKSMALQLATKERAAAEELIKDIGTRDRIKRAHALLQSAMLLSANEMMEMLSWLRLGSVHGLCDVPASVINELFISMQPASINVLAGARLPAAQRDEIRARCVREKLGEKNK